MRGNSTIPWPMAIKAPATLLLAAFLNVIANSGPGMRTPEREMSMTETKNKVKSVMYSEIQSPS